VRNAVARGELSENRARMQFPHGLFDFRTTEF